MRCYFMKDGRIENVELLKDGSDEDLIAQGQTLFQQHLASMALDGFEVWSGKRLVYRSPKPGSPSKSG